MIVVQIAPEIGTGTGVGGVAADLESAWQRAGVDVRRFTLEDAHGAWLPAPSTTLGGRLALLARVLWFSTVGAVAARRYCRSLPDAVSVCHNDALAGDVYVNHGIVQVAMAHRGNARWRLARNPVLLVAVARDRLRYRTHVHRAVVNLSSTEDRLLREVYGRIAAPTTVVGNGVDLERFRPPTPEQRTAARARFGLTADERTVLFVGHEHDRKGLPALLDAVARVPGTRLLVVGGDPAMIATARRRAAAAGVAARCTFTGPLPDVVEAMHAADVFCLPSAYESCGLVYLEALATGLPVVATAVGIVPDVVTSATGAIVPSDRAALADGLRHALRLEPGTVRPAARAAAERWSWDAVAARYLDVLRAARPDVVPREVAR
ncbi:glycosyltransferase family 4 protein [Isoptericola sp. NPDC055881]